MTPNQQADVFPPNFPGYAQLLASGITRRSQLTGKTIEELEQIKDIEPMIAQRIFILVSGEASDAEYDREKALMHEAAASGGRYPEVPIEPAQPELAQSGAERFPSDELNHAPFPFSTPRGGGVNLRNDGPTLDEYVRAGYLAENYPPAGYAAK